MTLSVFQHWDPLQTCLVGKSYPPEFYSFIKNANIRQVFENLAIETEEDLLNLVKILKSFNVEVLRPVLKDDYAEYRIGNIYLPPPLTPRDDIGVIGEKVYMPTTDALYHWRLLAQDSWNIDPPRSHTEWNNLPEYIRQEFKTHMDIDSVEKLYYRDYSSLSIVEKLAKDSGNEICYDLKIDSAMICRLGKDLYSGTWPGQNINELHKKLEKIFPDYRCHVIETNGHLDGVLCPVKEGLILANNDIDSTILEKHFPGWEIAYVNYSSTNIFNNYQDLKHRNNGKWWVPGQEHNHDFTNFVETYVANWTGFIEESSIGVNVLMIDDKNLLCTKEDADIFKVLHRHGITPHVVPFRHYNFWDSGIHCLTADLSRKGQIKDYFPSRVLL